MLLPSLVSSYLSIQLTTTLVTWTFVFGAYSGEVGFWTWLILSPGPRGLGVYGAAGSSLSVQAAATRPTTRVIAAAERIETPCSYYSAEQCGSDVASIRLLREPPGASPRWTPAWTESCASSSRRS